MFHQHNQSNLTYKYLLINSNDRKNGTPSNFQCELPYGIPIKCIYLLNAQIPCTYYNITDDNNTILIQGEPFSVPNGCYDLDQLMSALLVTLSNLTWESITYDDITQKITLTLKSIVPPLNVSFPKNGSLHSVLGFEQDYNQTAVSFTGSYSPNLNYNNIFIQIDELGNNQICTNNLYRAQSFTIPVAVNKNDYIEFNELTNFKQIINCFNNDTFIYNLTIHLKNIYGSELTAVGNWCCMLKIGY